VRAWGLLVASLAGCGGSDLPQPATIEAVLQTDEQVGVAGAVLPRALAVTVLADDGAAVPRASVRWRVVQGSGATLSDSVTVSDGTGEARVQLRLGPEPGTYVVLAALVTRPDERVDLAALALPAPRISSVSPATFTSGDTIVLNGSNLTDTTIVEIGGRAGTVVGASVTRAALSAVVPPCLLPGSVSVVVGLGTQRSMPVTATYQASNSMLALDPGEYVSVDATVMEACATFPPSAGDSVEYLVTPQSATGTTGQLGDFELRGNVVVATVAGPRAPPVTELPFATQFHDWLRNLERAMAREPGGPFPELGFAPADVSGISPGSRRTFKVCRDLPCAEKAQFASVTAEAKYVGSHAVLYVDVAAPQPGLDSADFEAMGRRFDDDLYEIATRNFGAESDVDQNGRLFVLMTPVVNGLTPKPQCSESIIDGFFYPPDIDPRYKGTFASNGAEVFYSLAPDPNGTVSCAVGVDFVRRNVPPTFIHELQHMISYYQHVLLRGGESEVLWLNEALSSLAEEIAAFYYQSLGDSVRFSSFAVRNVFNAYRYLKDPTASFVLPAEGGGTLPERGAGWLLVRWVVDQFGADVIRRMVETNRTGADNVAAATDQPFAQLAAEWFLTNYVSDLQGFTPPPRLRYATWRFRTTYGSLHQQLPTVFDRPFPIQPLQASGGAFAFTGTLRSGSGQYVRVIQAPNQDGFTMRLTGPSGAALASTLVARVNVIRLR
jgi:hypothetical protein